jgi:hypothetical protein
MSVPSRGVSMRSTARPSASVCSVSVLICVLGAYGAGG